LHTEILANEHRSRWVIERLPRTHHKPTPKVRQAKRRYAIAAESSAEYAEELWRLREGEELTCK